MEGQRKSMSSDSPGFGELTGWTVLEQLSAEDGGASGKEAMAVRYAKPVACQVKTCQKDNGLNVDAAVFLLGVGCLTQSNVTPDIQEVGKANGAQVEPVCQGMADLKDALG